jgi:hypothetical protein
MTLRVDTFWGCPTYLRRAAHARSLDFIFQIIYFIVVYGVNSK